MSPDPHDDPYDFHQRRRDPSYAAWVALSLALLAGSAACALLLVLA